MSNTFLEKTGFEEINLKKGKNNINKQENRNIIKKNQNNNKNYNPNNNINIKKEFETPENATKILRECNIYDESFELTKLVGSGCESFVYSVNIRNKKTREKVGNGTMKIIYKIKNEREAKKEAFLLHKLKDKNIINYIWNSKIEQGKPGYIIMEEAEYGHLRNFQRNIVMRMTFSESMICFIAYQILDGLNYLHKCRIAHMDIKLQNIVINKFLMVKLIDFNISLNYKNKSDDENISLYRVGTNFYMPKEILDYATIKVKDLNKIDLYSFGVVLFNLAFNKYPYKLARGDEDNYDTILKKVNENEIGLDNTEGYSHYFLDFLEKLLEKDINKRINLEQALNHYWIKGSQFLLDEKEKCFNATVFTSYLLTNHIKAFNDYINNKSINF